MPSSKAKTPTCIIASNRPWNLALADRIRKRTGWKVVAFSKPEDLTRSALDAIQPQYVFFPHWSYIIKPDVFAHHECIIFHMTDLPFGRGGSPLQNLIVRGHKSTKISALRCVQELDAGPIFLKRDLTLDGTAEEIFLRADTIIEDMIVTMIKKNPKPKVQKGKVTAFKRRKPADSDLRQAKDLDAAFDMIRMLDAEGYPNAFLEVGSYRLEFTRASRKVGGIVADVKITIVK